jgi:hypothetical protein
LKVSAHEAAIDCGENTSNVSVAGQKLFAARFAVIEAAPAG